MEIKDSNLMTVIKYDEGKQARTVCIDLTNVDFIEIDKKRIIYHIGDQAYYHLSSMVELEQVLYEKGFDMLDRPNIVNLKKVKHFDEKYGKVYFVENPDAGSKFATVAKIKYKYIKPLLSRVVSNNNDATQEVKSTSSKWGGALKGLLERK